MKSYMVTNGRELLEMEWYASTNERCGKDDRHVLLSDWTSTRFAAELKEESGTQR